MRISHLIIASQQEKNVLPCEREHTRGRSGYAPYLENERLVYETLIYDEV